MHYRDVHNKNGRADRDGLDAVLFPATDFCVECGCGPYTRLNSHVCKEATRSHAAYLRANPDAAGGDPHPPAAPSKQKKKRPGQLTGQRRPLGEVDAKGVPLDELVRLVLSASPTGHRDAIPAALWEWLKGFNFDDVDGLRSSTYRHIPAENTPHVLAAFDVAFYALESDAPVAAAPPGAQAGRAAGFGMSDERGHLLLHLLPRLLFFINPDNHRRNWAQALARRCRLVLEGSWEKLWAEVKAADAGYTSRDDAEYAKDMCAEVSGLIAAGLLSKGMARAQAKPMAALSPEVVEKLKALCPVGAAVDYSAAIEEHLPDLPLSAASRTTSPALVMSVLRRSAFSAARSRGLLNGARRALLAFALSTSYSLRRAGSPSKLPPTATPSAPGPFRPPSAPSSPAPP